MPLLPPAAQGLVMTLIAWRFNFSREAAKAMARTAAHHGAGAGAGAAADGALRQPLLEGRRCERLEAGMFVDPPGTVEDEQLPAEQVVADAGRAPAAAAAPTPQRGRQHGMQEGEAQASPKEARA